ncbi:unnamed protein product [Meganyctiphanes norvegica]|uniref:Uncharacterized protein n=1 Tax=Meganyctiphanes norvegica TaxID=48144 RepID=A0AAV2PYT8_MEGNR
MGITYHFYANNNNARIDIIYYSVKRLYFFSIVYIIYNVALVKLILFFQILAYIYFLLIIVSHISHPADKHTSLGGGISLSVEGFGIGVHSRKYNKIRTYGTVRK